ncbi:hypothetical protein KAR91_06700 [Candidatus Pacearchaeota archaeon]|nr:hypothetical protein [Candidatus Pacearchaeota archaeon]
MKTGTKSVLFGSHQFLIHPLFVALAWWKLYGFPFDPRLWFAFFLHDLGYIGKPNMDGPEGDRHPEFAARIMGRLFGRKWGELCLYHSRFYSKRDNAQYSKLCVADKLGIILEPWWLYIPRGLLSGEIHEYMSLRGGRNDSKYNGEPNTEEVKKLFASNSYRQWYKGVQLYMRDWIEEHKEIKPDTWTPDHKKAINNQGVWK